MAFQSGFGNPTFPQSFPPAQQQQANGFAPTSQVGNGFAPQQSNGFVPQHQMGNGFAAPSPAPVQQGPQINHQDAIYVALGGMIREQILKPISIYCGQRGAPISIDELMKVLQLPAETQMMNPSTGIGNLPGMQVVPGKKVTKPVNGPTCEHEITRGNNKGSHCPKGVVAGTRYCSSHQSSAGAKTAGSSGGAAAQFMAQGAMNGTGFTGLGQSFPAQINPPYQGQGQAQQGAQTQGQPGAGFWPTQPQPQQQQFQQWSAPQQQQPPANMPVANMGPIPTQQQLGIPTAQGQSAPVPNGIPVFSMPSQQSTAQQSFVPFGTAAPAQASSGQSQAQVAPTHLQIAVAPISSMPGFSLVEGTSRLVVRSTEKPGEYVCVGYLDSTGGLQKNMSDSQLAEARAKNLAMVDINGQQGSSVGSQPSQAFGSNSTGVIFGQTQPQQVQQQNSSIPPMPALSASSSVPQVPQIPAGSTSQMSSIPPMPVAAPTEQK